MDIAAVVQNLSPEVLDPELAYAQELINAEFVKLVHYDSVEYLLSGTTTGRADTLKSSSTS